MAENSINTEDETQDRRSNENNKGFPAFLIVILLIIIWILSNFTIFVCSILLVLAAKLITSSVQTREKVIATPSSSGIINSEPQTTINYLTEMRNRESVAETVANGGKEEDEKGVVQKDDTSTTPADPTATLSEMSEEALNMLILKDNLDGLLFTKQDIATLENSNSTGLIRDPLVTPLISESSTPSTPVDSNSAFVTENPMKIAISYSGKERKRVLNITRIVQGRLKTPDCPEPVFIDQDYQHEVCQVNGHNYVCAIYDQAHLVVVFLSPSYQDSTHCTGEWRTIVDRFITDTRYKNVKQLLLIKLGDYDAKTLGLSKRDFPLDGTRITNTDIAEIILNRWDAVEKHLAQTN
ncbi:hypothetical protein I4U23_023274 [Adineta vaga]|nr:hypothetical protein I4U23_023274 [Adineta vaga]